MSGIFGPNASAAFARASERARKVLKAGDRVRIDGSTVTFMHWGWRDRPEATCNYFAAKTVDELHPWNITKVNGQTVSFRDERGETEVGLDKKRFGAERVQRLRGSIRLVHAQEPSA